jgi:hypothetical protein
VGATDIPTVIYRTSCLLPVVASVIAAVLAAGCASRRAVPRPFPVPGGLTRPTESPEGPAVDMYALTATALALRGTPYRNGGSTPAGFDCSGFTQYVFSQHGVALPRGVQEQFESGAPVAPNEIAPGDLVFFATVAPGASHVGIAIGGDQFVHAPSSSGVVRVERFNSSYWSDRWIGGRRVNQGSSLKSQVSTTSTAQSQESTAQSHDP